MAARSPSSFRVFLVLLGIVLISVLVARIGVADIRAELSRLGPRSLFILVPYAVGTALGAFPWAWLLSEQVRPAALGTIASRFAASGANALLPFFGFAGEPCRLLWLPSDARASGLAAIVIDRLLYNSAGGLLLLVGAAAALTTRLPVAISIAAALIALVILAFTLLSGHVVSRWGIGRGVHRLLGRFLGGAYADTGLGAEVDIEMRRLLGSSRPLLLRGLLLHFAARVALSFEVYVALLALHAPTGIADAVVLATVPVATALFASSIPSQIGVQEGAQALACAALGFDPALGVALVLLQRLRQLAFVPLTPMLIAAARSRNVPAKVEVCPP